MALRMVRRFTVGPSDVLVSDGDPASKIATWPDGPMLRGMFFRHLLEILGPDAPPLIGKGSEPPRAGKYLPFMNYPQKDHARLFLAAARKKYPHEPLPQAMRLLGRQNYAAFLSTTVGQVMASLVRDAKGALLKLPDALAMVHPAGRITAESIGDRRVRIVFRGYVGWLDITMVGTVEAIVMHYTAAPTLDVTMHSDSDADFIVSW